MSTAFVPKHFPRTRLPSGRVLSDSQQFQYDVLRSVGGKLINNRSGWWQEVTDPSQPSALRREKIFGLNLTAMFKLVEMDLAECGQDPETAGYVFMLPDVAKAWDGALHGKDRRARYVRTNQIVKEK